MPATFQGAVLSRDDLASGLTNVNRWPLTTYTWASLSEAHIPPRGCLLGAWGADVGSPLPELLLVRDEDHADVVAWLGSYFAGLAPITQWCRILTVSQVERIASMRRVISLGRRLGAWTGATLAECSAQAGGAVNLKELPGSAATSTATYAAGRATAIWGEAVAYAELAHRHNELSQSLGLGARPVPADQLLPIWQVLAGGMEFTASADRRALEPIALLLNRAFSVEGHVDTAEFVQHMATEATDHYELPDLADCARGPQNERVRALDRLAERLLDGPRSPAIAALLGLGASFVDPGASVLPELLRRHSQKLPMAPIWLGLFAGAWAPLRVFTDHQGLGRLVSKSLLSPTDIETRPACDIAYEELSRWLAPGKSSQRIDVRGMSARTISVEILPGVTCAFAHSRPESAAPATTQQRVEPPRFNYDNRNRAPRSAVDVEGLLQSIVQRLERLEQRSDTVQQSLDLPEPKDTKTRRGRPLSKG